MEASHKSRLVVASADFLIGFFLIFGGNNIRVQDGNRNQFIGIISMVLGSALFFSAFRVGQGHNPRFRPFVYALLISAFAGSLCYQLVAKNPPRIVSFSRIRR